MWAQIIADVTGKPCRTLPIAEAAALGTKAMLVSYKEHAALADLLEKLRQMLAAKGVGVVEFYEVTPNPRIGQCRRGVEACKAEGVDLVIGVGGGSEHTLEEVGQSFTVTRERIRQIESKALRKLRHPSRSKMLRVFLQRAGS